MRTTKNIREYEILPMGGAPRLAASDYRWALVKHEMSLWKVKPYKSWSPRHCWGHFATQRAADAAGRRWIVTGKWEENNGN